MSRVLSRMSKSIREYLFRGKENVNDRTSGGCAKYTRKMISDDSTIARAKRERKTRKLHMKNVHVHTGGYMDTRIRVFTLLHTRTRTRTRTHTHTHVRILA